MSAPDVDEAFDLEAWLATATSPAEIVQVGRPVLRRRAVDVDPAWMTTSAWRRLLDRMVETMRAAPGVGLAAPQIGVPWRLFVAEDSEERLAALSEEGRESRGRRPLPLIAVVNPRLVVGAETATFYEGCLSVRGYGALVTRALSVDLTGLDASGRPLTAKLTGWPARIMQHEADHLEGTLYVDRMIARSFASGDDLGRLASLPVDDVMREVSPDEN